MVKEAVENVNLHILEDRINCIYFKTRLTGKQDRSFGVFSSILVGLSSLYFGYSFYKLFKNRQCNKENRKL